MIDLGDVVQLTFKTTDASGTPANAGAVTCTVTLPDGTSVTPGTSNPSTGNYTASYTPTQYGRHQVRWVATGAAAGAMADVFDVSQASPYFALSLADARRAVQIPVTDTSKDEDLRDYLTAVTHVIENPKYGAGMVLQRTITKTFEGDRGAILLPSAAASIVSVTVNGTVLDAGAYSLDGPAGVLYSGSLAIPTWFAPGQITVSYKVGLTYVPANVRLAARIILRQLWQSEQQGYRPQFGQPDNETAYVPMGFAIPRRALELLRATPRLPGFSG